MPGWLPLLLGFLIAIGPVSTDMYLPSFPAIEASFGTAPGTAQITLATWFAGLAVGQITQGTLSDRFGRRGPLLIGTIIYTAASAGCALAPSLGWLCVFRAVAAFGGSASMVIPRAVVRDLADGPAAARMMSRLMLVMGAAPILAPTLGGLVLGFASWHGIFWIACGYGAISILLVWRLLPDTLPPERRMALSPSGLVTRYAGICRERTFLTNALCGGFTLFGLFAYLGGSPGVFIDMLHVSPPVYGMIFGGCAGCYILASQFNGALAHRLGLGRLVRAGCRVMLLAIGGLTAMAFLRVDAVLPFFAVIAVSMACNGFITPNTTVGALSRHAAHAASASALMGTMQFLLGAVSGSLVGVLSDGTARPMALLMLAGAAAANVADLRRPRTS